MSIAIDASHIPAAGASGRLTITATRDCPWSASTDASWLTLGATSGQGSGALTFAASANPNGTTRFGHVVIAEQTATIEQAAAACRYAASPDAINVDASARQVSVALTATSGCAWTSRSDVPWIADVPAEGLGSATLRFAIAANAGPARSGSVTFGDAIVRVAQAGPGLPPPAPAPTPPPSPTPNPTPPPTPAPPTCAYGIKPTYYDAGRGPDDIVVNVTAGNGCAWTTSSSAPWVTVDAGRAGSGAGVVRLRIPSNSGPMRTAVVTIAGEAFTLRQLGGECRYSIRPTHYDAGRGPDDVRIAVNADAGCAWTAASSVSWVSVAEGQTGSGDGSVRLIIQSNDGDERSTTLTIAGEPFEVKQKRGRR